MQLELRLLGGFSVRIDGRDVPTSAWTQRRAAELVKLLALARGEWEAPRPYIRIVPQPADRQPVA